MKNALFSLVTLLIYSACNAPLSPIEKKEKKASPTPQHSSRKKAHKQDELIHKQSKRFINELSNHNYDQAHALLTPSLQLKVKKEKLKEQWEHLIKLAGTFTKIEKTVKRYKKEKTRRLTLRTQFANQTIDIQLEFNDKLKISNIQYRPIYNPNKIKPASYINNTKISETNINFGKKPYLIQGTLSLPKPLSDKKIPALILVAGWGPINRDHKIGLNKPFRDLALGLSSTGIAVLRYDKRSLTHKHKMQKRLEKLSIKEEIVDDAVSAFDFLKRDSRIDSKQIYLLGHSVAGYLLPRIAKRTKEAAGFIFASANSQPLYDLLLDQINYFNLMDLRINAHEKERLAQVKKKIENLKTMTAKTPRQQLPYNLNYAYWKDLLAYRPLKMIKTIKKPLLFLHGERDYQVSKEKNFDSWKKTLKKNKKATFILYPKANHILIENEGKPRPSEYKIPGHVAEKAIKDIAAFIKKE